MRALGALVVTVALLTGSAVGVAGQEPGGPTPTEELLSGMVAEEVEPGVFEVVNDGVRDLAISVVGPGYSVEVGPEGSVWLSSEACGPGVFRLGSESRSGIPDDPTTLESPIQVAPDGSLWVIAGYPDDRRGIFSFDSEGWTERSTTTERLEELAIGPDGAVWVTMTKGTTCPGIEGGECPGTFLMRLEEDGSLTTIEDWADVYDGDVLPYPLVVSPDGDPWLIGEGRSGGPDTEVLVRFDGSAWEALPLPDGFLNHPLDSALGFDPDGTLWVHAGGFVGDPAAPDLARFDDPGWTLFTVPDGTRSSVPGRDLLTVAADGSFWLQGKSMEHGCAGVARYDGTTTTPYLVGFCISDLAIAPDGSVWMYGEVGMQGHLYVITPEAVAGAE